MFTNKNFLSHTICSESNRIRKLQGQTRGKNQKLTIAMMLFFPSHHFLSDLINNTDTFLFFWPFIISYQITRITVLKREGRGEKKKSLNKDREAIVLF